MVWPLSQDYNEAIQNPGSCFADADLRTGDVMTNALGLPMPRSGNFADVYEVRSIAGDRRWAVKCFTRAVPGQRERYAAISDCLRQARLRFTVDFQYLEQGIRVGGQWYPVLKMDWVDGLLLNEFVRNSLDRPAMLDALAYLWAKLAGKLRGAGIAHGDLQHGNVLLVPGRDEKHLALKLIDYDGMYVPALARNPSGEIGHPSYQHPQRVRDGTYSAEVDRFPLLAIYTAIRALMMGGRPLWERFDNGDNLLFGRQDFEAPTKSALFATLLRADDSVVRSLAEQLIDAARSPLEQAPLLEEFLATKSANEHTDVLPQPISGAPAAPRAAPMQLVPPMTATPIGAASASIAVAADSKAATRTRRTLTMAVGFLVVGVVVVVGGVILVGGIGVLFATMALAPPPDRVIAPDGDKVAPGAAANQKKPKEGNPRPKSPLAMTSTSKDEKESPAVGSAAPGSTNSVPSPDKQPDSKDAVDPPSKAIPDSKDAVNAPNKAPASTVLAPTAISLQKRARIELADSHGVLDFHKEFTVEFWCRLTDSGSQYLVGNEAWPTMAPRDLPVPTICGWVLRTQEAQLGRRIWDLTVTTMQAGRPQWQSFLASAQPDSSGWRHVALVRDSKRLTLYLDGVPIIEREVSGLFFVDASGPLYLGVRKFGYIDRQVSAEFIGFRIAGRAIYREKFAPQADFRSDPADLVLLDFASPSDASQIVDRAGQKRHGALRNGAHWMKAKAFPTPGASAPPQTEPKLPGQPTPLKGFISLRPFRSEDHYFGHQEHKVSLIPKSELLEGKTAGPDNVTFEAVPGLASSTYCSLRAINLVQHYVTHGNFRIVLGKNDSSALFGINSTFKAVAGLANPGHLSFEALNWPGHYVRYRSDRQLYLDRNDNSRLFFEEATFEVLPGLAPKPAK
jgi:hypothetical protein